MRAKIICILAVILITWLSVELSADEVTTREKVIELGKSGEICKVYGHRWTDTTTNVPYLISPPIYPVKIRKCGVCEKEQYQVTAPPKWIDKNE